MAYEAVASGAARTRDVLNESFKTSEDLNESFKTPVRSGDTARQPRNCRSG
ncbi:hypothetical protein H4696_005226 [Amycolatopsis lexingtonensis]|uniref:Uncharacterized protein n=1 Tax=Amycolatopsis lexingtonensis TaxID=218822 RepID=A0ABR9I4L0_9PSEU|nr:hypothetical protein [Amycolatopsis lexingtonensis]